MKKKLLAVIFISAGIGIAGGTYWGYRSNGSMLEKAFSEPQKVSQTKTVKKTETCNCPSCKEILCDSNKREADLRRMHGEIEKIQKQIDEKQAPEPVKSSPGRIALSLSDEDYSENVQIVASSLRNDINICYNRRASAVAAGKIGVVISIKEDGSVENVLKDEDDLEIFDCVKEKIMANKYDQITRPVIFRKTWVFD